MGHTTPNLTLTIYARQMDRRDGEPERLKALVEGRVLVGGLCARSCRREMRATAAHGVG
jgi:hypothetical protein